MRLSIGCSVCKRPSYSPLILKPPASRCSAGTTYRHFFALQEGEGAYVPFAHSYMGVPEQAKRWYGCTKPILENPEIIKVCQNGKYDINVLARYDIAVQGVNYDTMLESYVLNSTATRHDMDSLALRYLNRSTISFRRWLVKAQTADL